MVPLPSPATCHKSVTSPLRHISPYNKWRTFTEKETYIRTKREQYSHNIGQFSLIVPLPTPASCHESYRVTLMTSHVTHMTHATSHVTYTRHLSWVTSRHTDDTSPHAKNDLYSRKKRPTPTQKETNIHTKKDCHTYDTSMTESCHTHDTCHESRHADIFHLSWVMSHHTYVTSYECDVTCDLSAVTSHLWHIHDESYVWRHVWM